MPQDTRKLVVRPEDPRRGPWLAAIAVGLLLAFAAAFELGRASAGYSLTTMFGERRARQAESERLRARVHDLEKRLADAEIARRVDRESYAQVERSLAELQSRLGEQGQELSFYRSIVSPATAGLRVQRVLVRPGVEPQHYRLRVVLIQAARQEAVVTGTVEITVDGQRGGRAASLPLAELGRDKPLPYSFRYFQEVETEVRIPVDFRPLRVQVEVRPRGAEAPVRATYPWKIETA